MGMNAEEQIAGGVNAVDDFYNAWSGNSGITISGFKSYYADSDLQTIGGLYLSMNASTASAAIEAMAANWQELQEPAVSDFTSVLTAAGAASPTVSSAIVSTAISGVENAGNIAQTAINQAASIETSAVSGVNSIISSPLIVMGTLAIIGVAVVAVMYREEIKRGIKDYQERKPEAKPEHA